MGPRHTRSYQTLFNLVLFTKMVSQRDLTIIVGSHMALRRYPSEIYILRLLAACLLVGQASSSLVRPTESLEKMSWHFVTLSVLRGLLALIWQWDMEQK